MIKPMLPTLYRDTPIGDDWVYEVKYDGFRCIVKMDENEIILQSRNGKQLNEQFPEIVQFLKFLSGKVELSNCLPIIFDGELAVLTTPFKANFAKIQKRGRTKTKTTIESYTKSMPATLLVFDFLMIAGKPIHSLPFEKRKEKGKALFKEWKLPLSPILSAEDCVQLVPYYKEVDKLWEMIKQHHSEGIIAKKLHSNYQEGKRTTNWIKVKNYKTVLCFVMKYQKDNGYFHVAVFDDQDAIVPIGLFSHGLTFEERQALINVMKENSYKEDQHFIYVNPGICVDLYYLELYQDQLRHPEFKQFRFDVSVEECSWNKIKTSFLDVPKSVNITNPEKPLWKEPLLTKLDYLHYLTEAAPYLLPFLVDRLLTVIRFPHGMSGESFYQKNCPDYAPSFVEKASFEGIDYILCNNQETLLWLGNQLALEFHIPFQIHTQTKPGEIVFDLDPPSADLFSIAVKGALLMKEVFDRLKLSSFIKTSGRKGLQVYIPLPDQTFSYEETRKFTAFIAEYLVSTEPDAFTVERLKKNRGNRVYIDYIQHAAGKTIISPYSLRGNILPTVAAPLYWEEIKDNLTPDQFTISSVLKRFENGDPFQNYFKSKAQQPFDQVLAFLEQV